MPTPEAYNYALVRVVPSIQRGECLNVGVILFCRTQRFLGARIALQAPRLHALAPGLALPPLQQQLDIISGVCAGERSAGPIAALPQSERFHWLVAPRSTIIQTSPVHGGLCTDPAATLEHLYRTLVCADENVV
jgi:hypothetical protein